MHFADRILMPKACANNTVIVHSQWPRMRNKVRTHKVLYVALTAIALAKTDGVSETERAPVLLRAGEENECMEEHKK